MPFDKYGNYYSLDKNQKFSILECKGNCLRFIGLTTRDTNYFENAIIAYDKALELGKNRLISYNKGLCLAQLNKIKEARCCFSVALYGSNEIGCETTPKFDEQ